MSTDPALDALLLPLTQGHLAWPGRGLFLRARCGATLQAAALPGLQCDQSFKPDADALRAAGCTLLGEGDVQRYPLVLVLPPRQRAEARALWARAATLVEAGGRILGGALNEAGARSHASDLEQLTGPLSSLSKHKCRVFWTGPLERCDTALLAQWQHLDAVQPIAEGWLSRPGLFSWDRIDPGSVLLAEQLPANLAGRAADLGAGAGYLAHVLLQRCPGITALDLYEAERRALDVARLNLTSHAGRSLEYCWHDVTSGLPQRYDVIISNPPFHTGSGDSQPDVGRRFIAAAAQALRPGGQLWLVANRHLAYEVALAAADLQVRHVIQAHGFKVLAAVRARGR